MNYCAEPKGRPDLETREQAAAAARLICYAAQEIGALNVTECEPLLRLCIRWMQMKYQLSDAEIAGAASFHNLKTADPSARLN